MAIPFHLYAMGYYLDLMPHIMSTVIFSVTQKYPLLINFLALVETA